MNTQVMEREQNTKVPAIIVLRDRLLARRAEIEHALEGSGISADRFREIGLEPLVVGFADNQPLVRAEPQHLAPGVRTSGARDGRQRAAQNRLDARGGRAVRIKSKVELQPQRPLGQLHGRRQRGEARRPRRER